MPIVDVSIIEGRSPEQIRRPISEVTGAVERALVVPADPVRVLVRELPATHWAAGDETIAERNERPQ